MLTIYKRDVNIQVLIPINQTLISMEVFSFHTVPGIIFIWGLLQAQQTFNSGFLFNIHCFKNKFYRKNAKNPPSPKQNKPKTKTGRV